MDDFFGITSIAFEIAQYVQIAPSIQTIPYEPEFMSIECVTLSSCNQFTGGIVRRILPCNSKGQYFRLLEQVLGEGSTESEEREEEHSNDHSFTDQFGSYIARAM